MILNKNWKFIKDDVSDAYKKEFDDSNWRTVNVPHDYAVEGPFDSENDKQYKNVVADGIITPVLHIGRTGGLPVDVPAWYRKTFSVSKDAKHVFIEFDGAMCNSTVYVNGSNCGGRPYGYSSFSVDVTDFVEEGENSLAVSLKPETGSSRFYPGAGIYRNVRLIEKNEVYFPYANTFVNPSIKDNKAVIDCTVEVENFGKEYEIQYIIKNAVGDIVASYSETSSDKESSHIFKLKGYVKWNIHDSYMYTLETKITLDGELMDENSTKFGIRTIRFDPDKGFFLNEKQYQLNGVCMHHDLGALGAAYNESASRRQIEKLVEIGTNAIRMTHNPPAPEMLDLCDEFGIVVIDEAFDEWTITKVQNGYAKYFKDWAKKDLETMVKRDRNHPSIIMWSTGNEVLEQCQKDGWHVVKFLSEICHNLDDSRPVTAGLNNPIEAFDNGFADYIDVVGLNYKPHLYERFHHEYPNVPLFGSETASTSSSRGQYYLPSFNPYIDEKRDDLQLDASDLSAPMWSSYAEREFFAQDKLDYVFGHFVWTGFDYIGEPSPYRDEWPSRSSYWGIYDLAGIPKTLYYSYMSRWTDNDVIHLFPHWNWNEGDVVDIHCYSNYDEVELFVNNKSQGISVKNPYDETLRHRHMWKGIEFEAGEIKAVAVRKPELSHTIKTAYQEKKIILSPEKTEIKIGGDDLVYIQCSMEDEFGTYCPTAQTKLYFEVSGAGEYVASDAGDATSLRPFAEKYCNLFNGKAMIIVRAKDQKGEIKIKVKVDDVNIEDAQTIIFAV